MSGEGSLPERDKGWDYNRRVDVPPEHREAVLDSIRQASEVMGEHPESFRVGVIGNKLLGLVNNEPPYPSGTIRRSRHVFDISETPPRYLSLREEEKHREDTEWRTGHTMSPFHRERVGFIDRRTEGVWRTSRRS